MSADHAVDKEKGRQPHGVREWEQARRRKQAACALNRSRTHRDSVSLLAKSAHESAWR